MLSSHPTPTSRVWNGVGKFDAAFERNETIYFFKGEEYFEFDHKYMRLNKNPMKSAQEWMMCPELTENILKTNEIKTQNQFNFMN